MNTPKPTRCRRGQATVEMAVLMVALIPTFLYVLTSDDLLRYRLNLQEVVVSSPWDYTHLDYEANDISGNALVLRLRQTYGNINLAYSADASAGDEQTGDITATMTSAHWDVDGSQRVNCDKMGSFVTSYTSPPISNLVGNVNKGGLYFCNAALGVANVRLINRFLQDWAGDVNVSDKAQGEAWGLNRQHFSVMADTWAMTRIEDVQPNSSGRGTVLQSRVDSVYSTPSLLPAVAKAVQYVTSANQILNSVVVLQDSDEGLGDNTATPEVGFSKDSNPQASGNSNFDASPWRHKGVTRGGTYQQAYNGRTNTYMGRPLQ